MYLFLCAAYFVVLLCLAMYGLHRSHLVLTVIRHRKKLRAMRDNAPTLADYVTKHDKLPHVTIQLPLYNEATVATRLLDHVVNIRYPRELFEIQVLDDSTDETRALVRDHVADLVAKDPSLDIAYIHRVDRTGYKAGALDAGLKVAKGELIAIFDADFLPQPEFLEQVVPDFLDREVGMVQARWGHLNRGYSLLTRVQALMLDGHHLVENRARMAAGWLFNFSGTGGIWRKEAIASAGGWQHDTLTEDLDLSYRAQLAGWRFVYRDNVVSPAELPEDVSAFRAQQFRWAKGTVQTSRKLMKRVMTSNLTLSQRVEAFFHLTPHFAYPLMVFLSLLLLPALVLMPATNPQTMLLIDLPLCIGTTGSLAAFYAMAEAAQGRRRIDALKQLPALLALGAGLAPHLSKAVLEGLGSMAGEFVRTPKKGIEVGTPAARSPRYRARADLPMVEVGLCLFSLASTVASIETGHWFATPFAMLFTFGYGYVASLVASEQMARRKAAAEAPALAQAPDSMREFAASAADAAIPE
ncbi:glycosyltransferase [Pendulispora albinea]|uniref:Glycosyltransferase n=1 Tax=Pendulispora albinea TaxID=2741071 RepID=A0ABZ2M2Y2_9BACT